MFFPGFLPHLVLWYTFQPFLCLQFFLFKYLSMIYLRSVMYGQKLLLSMQIFKVWKTNWYFLKMTSNMLFAWFDALFNFMPPFLFLSSSSSLFFLFFFFLFFFLVFFLVFFFLLHLLLLALAIISNILWLVVVISMNKITSWWRFWNLIKVWFSIVIKC